MLATISLTVVLPLLPVIPTTMGSSFCRNNEAIFPSAVNTSSTSNWGTSKSSGRVTSSAYAPKLNGGFSKIMTIDWLIPGKAANNAP